MNTARFLLPIIVVAALVSGCGGGSSAKLSSSDVAVVGNTHIPTSDFQTVMGQARASYKSSGQTFPKEGTSSYETIKSQAVSLLVQQAERNEKAASMGIKVTAKQVQTRLDTIKKQYFGGSDKKYRAQLKKQKLTDAQVRQDIKSQLIGEALYAKVTQNVTVSDADAATYYNAHLQLYSQPETRDVQYILVKKKSLADSIYAQLKAGNAKTWCTLAKKYSQDPGSKNSCGKGSFSKGQTVKVFDTVLFAQPTNVIHAPVYDPQKYKSYFIIEPTAKVKPHSTTPLTQVSASIKQTLLQTKKNDTMNTWVSGLSKQFCSGSKIKYQVGYTPNPDPCTSTITNATTT
jgi:parvulin-like peptidyl-prolyl isomerase